MSRWIETRGRNNSPAPNRTKTIKNARDRGRGRGAKCALEQAGRGPIQIPAAFDQVREEVTRPCRQEGEDRARHGIRERDRGDRTLDDGGPVETQRALSPGLPDRNDAARWQSGTIRPCRARPIASESMLPLDAT